MFLFSKKLLMQNKIPKDYFHTILLHSYLKPLLCCIFNPFPSKPWLYVSAVQVFLKKTAGKGEIAHNEQFLLFPKCFPFPKVFSTCLKNFLPFSSNLQLSSANSFIFERVYNVVWERAKYQKWTLIALYYAKNFQAILFNPLPQNDALEEKTF